VQVWTGPEDFRRLWLLEFLDEIGGKVVSLNYQPPSPPGNIPGTHFC
jgi:hypothetical protein